MAQLDQNVEQSFTVPNVYFNGFQLGISNADVNGVLLLNNAPAISFSMSYTTAKTLSVALSEMMKSLEKATQHSIMTNEEVAEGLNKLANENADADTH